MSAVTDISTSLTESEIYESRVSRMFFAGLSSATALFVTHPLDVIKLNLQVKPLSIRQVITYHYVKDRGVTRIYKGVVGSMARSMVYCSLRFEIYELAKRRNLLNTLNSKIAVASISGGIGGFLVTPMSKIHVRTQNDDLLPPDERRYYKGMVNGLYRIYREEGLRLMFAGSGASSLRGVMSSIGQIALYDEAKQQLLRHPYFEDGFVTFLISSITAGFAATLLQQPFEVVHIKLMNAPPGKFRNFADVVRETARNYGVQGFFKGLVPGFVRLVPQTVITYMMLEHLRLNFGILMRARKRGDVVEIISIDNESQNVDRIGIVQDDLQDELRHTLKSNYGNDKSKAQ